MRLPYSIRRTLQTTTVDTVVWPDDVIARYLTVASAFVDVRSAPDRLADIECSGCGPLETGEHPDHARSRAQKHAEKCRALPRPRS